MRSYQDQPQTGIIIRNGWILNQTHLWKRNLQQTALLVCRTQVNRSTGKSPFELVYGTQPNIIQVLTGPKLEIPSEVPPHLDPQVVGANSKQTAKENECLQKTFVPIHNRHEVGDKVWVMNVDKSKLQPEKVGPEIILKVNDNNTYLVQGLGKCKQDKTLHHDCLQPCKARQKQQETALPATDQQLVQYGAQAPDNLPENLPPEEANLQLGGGGLKLQA
ncbi:hypothetical protein DSO57_1012938 [Entomophthora muscae]|uniref:Uncharacterized protein n=1 Tax=Entomophthora muscae TaxID=34485 RepID=A0ACC2SVG2_9FUNG|nr:hypothetical protein DSO57_1012938 [Entomophthora muscae]